MSRALRRLVVGLDGTDSSARALDWAAATVGRHGTIHAVTAISPLTELGVEVITGDSVDFRRELERDLAERWTKRVRSMVGELTTETSQQNAADALSTLALKHDADAIVVGAHVPKRMLPKTIGHTTRLLLRQLPVALIVVPDGFEGGLDDGGPVVVGIGHGEATEAAVWWASQLADERTLAVGLVRATGDAPVFKADGLLDLMGYYIRPEMRTKWTTKDLARFAAAVQENSDHDLAIQAVSRAGLPALQLVTASDSASLLVIGQHWSMIGLGVHTPQPLRYALQHARCPVAVIPEAAVHVG